MGRKPGGDPWSRTARPRYMPQAGDARTNVCHRILAVVYKPVNGRGYRKYVILHVVRMAGMMSTRRQGCVS